MLLFWSEEEVLQKLSCCKMLPIAKVNIVSNLANDIYHLLVFPEFQSVLREISESYRLSDIEPSFIWSFQS